MDHNEERKARVRFKFRTGEEFEAEGNTDFIERQRAQFLHLIGKDGLLLPETPDNRKNVPFAARQANFFTSPALALSAASNTHTSDEPAFLRKIRQEQTENKPPLRSSSVREREGQHSLQEIRLWEEISKTEDKLVILRRKNRMLTAETAALVLLGAAKILLGAANGYSALHLAKALAKSGYGGERLDRVLAGEMQRGTIKATGSKRARAYILSDEGFAKAFVLAEKLAAEWR